MRCRYICLSILLFIITPVYADSFVKARDLMIDEIEESVRATASYIGKDKLDSRVIDALKEVPRHAFVPEILRDSAYQNRPLPIGKGQTISQPYIVALMTDLLETRPDSIILEVGTGSGYQAAILSRMVKHVYSIEIIADLSVGAQAVIHSLDYNNIQFKVGDGYQGWPKHAPFDGIIVTAAPDHIPQPLIEQLKVGGRLVIPVGAQSGVQELMVIQKNKAGELHTTKVLPVQFVPLTGDH